jgi:hypothetical protein
MLSFLVLQRSKAKVYTINLSMAYGQAAMLLSLGEKGKRGVLPNSISTSIFSDSPWPCAYMNDHDKDVLTFFDAHFWTVAKLHLPKVHKSGGAAIDMWIKVKPSSSFRYICTMILSAVLCVEDFILHSGKRVGHKHGLLPGARVQRSW